MDMTEKAQRILDKLNKKNRRTPVSIRERVLQEFNASTLDDVGPVAGGEKESKLLQEMNQLDQEHDQYMQGLKGG